MEYITIIYHYNQPTYYVLCGNIKKKTLQIRLGMIPESWDLAELSYHDWLVVDLSL